MSIASVLLDLAPLVDDLDRRRLVRALAQPSAGIAADDALRRLHQAAWDLDDAATNLLIDVSAACSAPVQLRQPVALDQT